jgi:hypothetical protein
LTVPWARNGHCIIHRAKRLIKLSKLKMRGRKRALELRIGHTGAGLNTNVERVSQNDQGSREVATLDYQLSFEKPSHQLPKWRM